MNLKRQLKLYLEKYELSPSQLSKRSGVSKQVLSLWLSGGNPKNIEQVKKVAESLHTSVDHLCFGTGLEPLKDFESITQSEWLGGIFEIKFRRLNR